MSTKRLRIVVAVVTVLVILLALTAMTCQSWYGVAERVTIPDEKEAGLELLAGKLKGPGYFSADGATEESGVLWVTSDKIEAQVKRVIHEREFTSEETMKLNQVIKRLREPQPSRMTGGERVNLVRLNLALDAIRK